MLGILIIFCSTTALFKGDARKHFNRKYHDQKHLPRSIASRIISRKTILRRNPAARRCCHYVFYPGKSPPIKRRSSSLNVKTNQACNASSWFECRASPSSPRLALPCLAQPCFALPSLASPCPARPGAKPVLIQTGLPRLAEGCNIDPTGSDLPRPRPA